MKKLKPIFILFFIGIFCLNLIPIKSNISVIAAGIEDPNPEPPSFSSTDIASTTISHERNDINNSYVNRVGIRWTPHPSPNRWGKDGAYDRAYYSLHMVPREGGQGVHVEPVSKDITQYTFYNPGIIKSGTIYDINAQAHHVHDRGLTEQIHSSPYSNTLSVLTDIDINATPVSQYSINIEWDDVILNGDHIDYEVYVSTHKDFVGSFPVYIRRDHIGNIVKPIEVNGRKKLSYTHEQLQPSTVYYVKIKPIIPQSSNIQHNIETETIVTYTYIAAKMTLYSSSDFGNWWKVHWTPLTEGSVVGNEDITYQIIKTNEESGDVVIQKTKTPPQYILIRPGEEKQYRYRIFVNDFITQLGDEIDIFSAYLSAETQDTPYTPTIPKIEEVWGSEKMTATQNSVKLLWQAGEKPGGGRDDNLYYDIWFLEDIELVDKLRGDEDSDIPQPNISNFKPAEANFIQVSGSVTGYKHIVTGLNPNTTYYVVMKAKKAFVVEDIDGNLVSRYFVSDPALKAVITTPGQIGYPETIPKPPFRVKNVGMDYAEIVWRNEWYEIMRIGGGMNWESRDDKGDLITQAYYDSVDTNLYYKRHVKFDSQMDINYIVSYIEFTDDLDGMNLRDLDDLPSTVHSLPISNKLDRIEQEYKIEGLKPNKEYFIWIKAVKAGYESDISNPIVVTTPSDSQIPIPTPAVPVFNNHRTDDKYIDLSWWDSVNHPNPQYTYYLKYALEDDISKAEEEIVIEHRDLLLGDGSTDYKQFYRVADLQQETRYYFWVKAKVGTEGEVQKESDWSDSYPVSTLPYQRPETPKGFGIKNADDAIGKNHLTYEWIYREGLEYILELSTDIDGKDKRTFQISGNSEYKAEGLRSNQRYYAILYAYDPETELKSSPTAPIGVKTLRSDDDYDSDNDNETQIDWDIIDSKYEDGVWINEIIGINADRFIQMIYRDNYLDYVLDLSEPSRKNIKKRKIRISYKVFDALSQIKEYLKINIGNDTSGLNANREFIFRPDTITLQDMNSMDPINAIVDIEFTDNKTNIGYFEYGSNTIIQSGITGFDIMIEDGNKRRKLPGFENPVKVIYPFKDYLWTQKEMVKGAYFNDEKKSWTSVDTLSLYKTGENWGYSYFEIPTPANICVAKRDDSRRFMDIQGYWLYSDINRLISNYALPSLGNTGVFRPNDPITLEESTKLLLDVLGNSYGNQYLQTAYKSGITKLVISNGAITRQEAVSMLMRVYEIKTGEKAISDAIIFGFSDIAKITNTYLPHVKAASEIGILIGESDTLLNPTGKITRAEMAAMLTRLLTYIGEIE